MSKLRGKIGKRGYRLHDERIAYSQGEGSIRTVKFELQDPFRISGLKELISRAIIHDNKTLYGNINLNDYIAWRKTISADDYQNGVREPSFLGLWIKALSLGFVFSNKVELEFKQYLGIKSNQETLFEEIPNPLRTKLDQQNWINWLKTDMRSNSKSTNPLEEQLRNKFLGLFKEEYKNDDSVLLLANKFSTTPDRMNDILFRLELFGLQASLVQQENSRTEKILFACDIQLNFSDETSDWTNILDTVIDYWKSRVGDAVAKKFLGIGDNGNHFNNGLFGKFIELLKSDEAAITQYISVIGNAFNLANPNLQEIRRRIILLQAYAQGIPSRPELISKWADYRSYFSGTVESWYSNRERNKSDALKQFFGEIEIDQETQEPRAGTEGIGVFLQKIYACLPEGNEIKEGLLQETISYIATLEKNPKKLNKEFTDTLNNYYLPVLREELNSWSQQSPTNAGLLPKMWFTTLKKRLQSMPLFFGENKRQQWEQIFKLKQLIRANIAQLEQVINQPSQEFEMTEKQVDQLATLYNRIHEDGNRAVVERLLVIMKELHVDFRERTERSRFYLSGFERSKYKKLEIPRKASIQKLLTIANLQPLFNESKLVPQVDNLLRDTVQLSKIVLSAQVHYKSREIQREVTLAHSNLAGYSALISKKEFIARYSAQSTNGGQTLLAVGTGPTKKDSEKTVERYYYAFPSSSKGEFDKHAILLQKIIQENSHRPQNFIELDGNPINSKRFALQVVSSKYQIQFLDWFFGKHTKRKTQLEVGGAFTIAESEHTIDWTQEYPTIEDKRNDRVFVSQPFTIVPQKSSTSYSPEGVKNRFIGVDIGEYGLAWSLIEAMGSNISQTKNGFIADWQQQTLKQDVKERRKSQARQTFSSPDTKIARVRESLIGSYKNKLESLALTNKATLSFEYEVSGFEVGGNRIAKIYDSIKRGVVHKKDNNPQNNQTWGKTRNLNWAYETPAAGTSQFCTACKRWSSILIDDKKVYTLQEYDDSLFSINLGSSTVRLLGKEGMKFGDTIQGREVKSLIYKAMRPNSDGLGMRIVERKFGPEKFKRLMETFGQDKQRGNMAIFVCPFTDCHHIADADLQAAFTIAIRGYLKENVPKELRLKDGKIRQGVLTKEYLTEQASTLEFEPIGIE